MIYELNVSICILLLFSHIIIKRTLHLHVLSSSFKKKKTYDKTLKVEIVILYLDLKFNFTFSFTPPLPL